MAEGFYRLFRFGDAKVQVDSAIRDGIGRKIDTTYPVKKEEEWNDWEPNSGTLILSHGLGAIPIVSIYEETGVYDNDGKMIYEEVYADVSATIDKITINFTHPPLPINRKKIKIKAVI